MMDETLFEKDWLRLGLFGGEGTELGGVARGLRGEIGGACAAPTLEAAMG